MRQYVLTRSAYGPGWDIESNRRRLAITVGVTVASMAAQTHRDWTWIVAVHKSDPLLDQRKAAFESAGVPVKFLEVNSKTTDRSDAAAELYGAAWHRYLGNRKTDVVAMTRLDDDDALAPWVLGKIRAFKTTRRMILVMPNGLRVWGGRCTVVTHKTNAMQTLLTQPGDTLHVYGYKHRFARKTAAVREVDQRMAWVWARHDDTISGWHQAESNIPLPFRAMFPIDWELLGANGSKPVRGGRMFR